MSNPGGLPSGMLPSDLGRKSVRRNLLIADLLHRIEFIEKAGTGIRRMREEARAHGTPAPVFETTGFFTAIFRPLATLAPGVADQVIDQVTDQVADQVERLIRLLAKDALGALGLMRELGLSHRPTFRTNYLYPALKAGLIAMTIPDKPRSGKQRYGITPLGREILEKNKENH